MTTRTRQRRASVWDWKSGVLAIEGRALGGSPGDVGETDDIWRTGTVCLEEQAEFIKQGQEGLGADL